MMDVEKKIAENNTRILFLLDTFLRLILPCISDADTQMQMIGTFRATVQDLFPPSSIVAEEQNPELEVEVELEQTKDAPVCNTGNVIDFLGAKERLISRKENK